MGGFYGSVQVKGADLEQVKAVAERVAARKKIKCLLGPEHDGWIGIYPELSGQDEQVGLAIARELACDVLHLLVHDDDVLAYWLWRNHELVDSYYSRPGYFDDAQADEQQAMTGNPRLLASLGNGTESQFREILARDRNVVFEVERLQALASLLGISNAVTSYEYLKAGESEEIGGRDQFIELAEARIAKEKNAAQIRSNRTADEKRRLKESGFLLSETEFGWSIPRACPAGDGFLVSWGVGGRETPKATLYRPPWTSHEDLPLALDGTINATTSNWSGTQVALCLGKRIVVWEVDGWRQLAEVAEQDWAIGARMSMDGMRLAHVSRKEIIVTDIASGRCLGRAPVGDTAGLAIHPSGQWAVVGGSSPGMLDLSGEPAWKRLYVGGRASAEAWAKKTAKALQAQGVPDDQIQEFVRVAATSLGNASLLTGGSTNERTMHVGFSQDGYWFWCGTDQGLRVFEWDAVLRTGENDLTPRFTFEPPSMGSESNERYRLAQSEFIYAVAEAPDSQQIVFGGIDGVLYEMMLSTGSVRELLTMPERTSIVDLQPRRDGPLGIICRSNLSEAPRRERKDKSYWQVWSLAKLLERGPEH